MAIQGQVFWSHGKGDKGLSNTIHTNVGESGRERQNPTDTNLLSGGNDDELSLLHSVTECAPLYVFNAIYTWLQYSDVTDETPPFVVGLPP